MQLREHTIVFSKFFPKKLIYAAFLIISLAAGMSVNAEPLRIAWSPNSEPDLDGYTVYYGTASGVYDDEIDVFNNTTYETPELPPGYTYYFAVKAYDLARNYSDFSEEIHRYIDFPDTDPPVISDVHTDGINSDSAIVHWVTDEPADGQVEYGTTPAYGQQTPIDPDLDLIHAIPLNSLAPDTTYHYRVKSRDAAGNLAVSGDYTFTTPNTPDTTPPVISDVEVINVTDTEVTIRWITDEPATSRVQYGYTAAYGFFTPLNSTLVTTHTVVISGLDPDTRYHFRVISQDATGNQAASGDYVFDTEPGPDTTPPVIDNIEVIQITDTTAVITWTTDEPATSQVEYGTTPAYGLMSDPDNNLVLSHAVHLTSLTQDTLYHFRVHSRDEAENLATSGDGQFTTEETPDTTPPDAPQNVRFTE